MNQPKARLAQYWNVMQTGLFPLVEIYLGKTTPRQQRLIQILEVIRVEEHCGSHSPFSVGRPPCDRAAMARSFVAKAVYQIATTELLIEHLKADRILRRICGFEYAGQVPGESTYSRAFDEFAETELPSRVHAALVSEQFEEHLFGHANRDSTAVAAREKAIIKPKVKVEKQPKKRGRPKKGEVREKAEPVAEKMLQKQRAMSAAELKASIPTACDIGTKVDSKGYKITWKGYKLHLDTVDGRIPVAAFISSASVHDSQVAIPLSRLSTERVTYCYELMDSAYDSEIIREDIRSRDHVPLIDHNKRRGEKKEFAPHEAERYKTRTIAEQVNARLKDEFGLLNIRVKKHKKVFCHLMFSVLALTGDEFLRFMSTA
ncbi:transposase [bacterium]|nr:transposase [bacterium]